MSRVIIHDVVAVFAVLYFIFLGFTAGYFWSLV